MFELRRIGRCELVISGLLLQEEFCVSSVGRSVGLLVGLSVGNERVLCKNGRLRRNAVWIGRSDGGQKITYYIGSRSPTKEHFFGKLGEEGTLVIFISPQSGSIEIVIQYNTI